MAEGNTTVNNHPRGQRLLVSGLNAAAGKPSEVDARGSNLVEQHDVNDARKRPQPQQVEAEVSHEEVGPSLGIF